jgi:hypothetical protein
MKLNRTCQVSFCQIAPLKIRGARPARLPLLSCPPHGSGRRELSRKQAEPASAETLRAGRQLLWQAGEL